MRFFTIVDALNCSIGFIAGISYLIYEYLNQPKNIYFICIYYKTLRVFSRKKEAVINKVKKPVFTKRDWFNILSWRKSQNPRLRSFNQCWQLTQFIKYLSDLQRKLLHYFSLSIAFFLVFLFSVISRLANLLFFRFFILHHFGINLYYKTQRFKIELNNLFLCNSRCEIDRRSNFFISGLFRHKRALFYPLN